MPLLGTTTIYLTMDVIVVIADDPAPEPGSPLSEMEATHGVAASQQPLVA
jgi:hypothetical protein